MEAEEADEGGRQQRKKERETKVKFSDERAQTETSRTLLGKKKNGEGNFRG